jgi:hypothetical protein
MALEPVVVLIVVWWLVVPCAVVGLALLRARPAATSAPVTDSASPPRSCELRMRAPRASLVRRSQAVRLPK